MTISEVAASVRWQRPSSKAATTPTGSKFRGDIQGLRAVAVLSVAFDHADVGPFSGGYVGVDVFFVISGFLITQLLLAEWQRTGSISLTGFYSRRARRILPAATLVLIATVTAGLVLLNFVRAKALVTDAVWATFFAANVRFGQQGTDYFAADTPPSPLQHYWSLAVEEQFYLVWPLLLAVLLGAVLVRRRRAGTPPVNQRRVELRVLAGLAAVVAASFVFCLQLTVDNPTAAYFSTLARIWELGLGAAFAVLVPALTTLPRAIRSLMQWSGLALIAYAVLTFDETTRFPGSAALVPVVGAAFVLGGGCGDRPRGIGMLLENRPMLIVGDWSYSLYLWHWPVLIIAAEYAGHALSWQQNLGLLTLALVLSGLTYRFVENPFRRARVLSMRPRQSLLLYPVAVVVTLAVCFGANAQIESEAAVRANVAAISTSNFGDNSGVARHFSKDDQRALVQASALAARNNARIPGQLSPGLLQLGDDKADVGDCDYVLAVRRLCERGAVGSTRSIVLFGDSHARHWIPAVEKIAEDHGLSAYYLVKPGCNAAQMEGWAGDQAFLADCLDWRAWAIEQIQQLQPSMLIISGDVPDQALDASGEVVDGDAALTQIYRAGLVETLTKIGPAAGRVFILGDAPGLDERPADCLAGRGNNLGDCAGTPSARDAMEISAAQGAAAATGATFVATMPWFCADGICPAVVGSTITYWDREHVTREYALKLAPELDVQLGL